MKQLAIFASGSGTNAENITRLFHQGGRVRVAVALCNRRECGLYKRMEALGVPVVYMPNSAWENDPERIVETLRPYGIDMIVLAGFLRNVRPEIIDSVGGNIVNIHPSLLPAHGGKGMYGMKVHEAVIAAGEAVSGVTVHYVTDMIDGGAIIMQREVPVMPGDTPESLAARIHETEYDIFPRAIVKALEQMKTPPSPPQMPTPDNPVADAPVSHASAGSTVPPADEKTEMPPASPDEQWADALHIKNYSDARVEAARTRAAAVAPLPPAIGKQAPNIPARHPAITAAAEEGREIPRSYMWVSIVMTLLFSTIPGIVAIVYSASVSSRLSCGDLAGAARASRNAQIWIIVSFVLGVLAATVWMPVSMLF